MHPTLTRSCMVAVLLSGCGLDATSAAPSTGGSASSLPVPGATSGGSSGAAGAPGAGQAGSAAGDSQGGSGNSSGGGLPGGAGGAGSSPGGAGSSAGGAGGSQVDAHFSLLWRDEFESFDDGRWAKSTHTFEENLARFTEGNVAVEGGLLKLRVTATPSADRGYSAAEVYTKQDFKYGRFEGRIKFCAGSGVVSSLFTYKEDVEESWQEIDIEFLGYLPKSIQYNLISGNLANRKYQPKVVNFQFSPQSEFHDYALEWTPDGVTFYVDGAQTHHDVQVALQDVAKLRMNAWPTNNAVTEFAGKLDATALPCEAQYDWVQAYSYTP